MGIQINGQTDTITGISGNITVGTDLTVPGVLTYEDVTNVDSVGLITARDGITVKGNPAEVRIQHTGNSSYSRLISDSNNQLNIYTGGGPNLAMVIDQNQNIGIGTDTPGAILEVFDATSNTILNVKSGDAGSVINIIDPSQRSSIEQSGTTLKIISDTGAEFANSDIRLQVDGSTKMMIDSSSRVLIGRTSTSQGHTLQVQASGGANAIAIQGRSVDDQSEITFLENDNSTILGQIQHLTTHSTYRSRVGYIRFDSGGVTEKMRLDSSGRLGLGVVPEAYHANNKAVIRGDSGYAILGRGDNALNISQNFYYDSSDAGKYIANGEASVYQQQDGQHLFYSAVSGSANAGASMVERLRIFNDGSVRIGDSSIAVAAVGSGPTLAINGAAPEITLRDSATNNPYAVMRVNDYGSLTLEADQGNNAANSTIHFRVDNAERMRINSSFLLYGDSASDLSGTHATMFCGSNHAFQREGDAGTYLTINLGAADGTVSLEADARSGNYPDMRFITTNDEQLRVLAAGHIWKKGDGALWHGTTDINNFSNAGRSDYNKVSIRAGDPNDGTSPTNDNSAIKIYPAGNRGTTVGTLSGGIAWQHLDPDNGSWDTAYGAGSQIWMGSAIHDTPGQERSRFNLWMNSGTTGNSNPGNLAIEAYPNGMVRHPKVPAFMVRNSNNANAFTADSIATWNVTIFNNGSGFASNKFTAPVDGLYFFSCMMLSNASTRLFHDFRVNGTQVTGTRSETHAVANSYTTATISMVYNLSASDYVEVYVANNNAYGGNYANFNGYLIG